jgi:UDP-N-acetylmuramyl pentapeptide phosphotransferase/UDP-N-acetylglucosamine-1-phosphate transferase
MSFALIGFADDYAKVSKQSSAGVSGRLRLILGFAIAGVAAYWAAQYHPVELQNQLALPIFKDTLINLGVLFIPFSMIVIVGAANAVNMTDGLDGLAIMPVMIAAGAFAIIAYFVGRTDFTAELGLHYVPGTGELAIFAAGLIGGGLGFLWYNAPPAAVFMGDTGSLALGGALGAIAVATKHHMILQAQVRHSGPHPRLFRSMTSQQQFQIRHRIRDLGKGPQERHMPLARLERGHHQRHARAGIAPWHTQQGTPIGWQSGRLKARQIHARAHAMHSPPPRDTRIDIGAAHGLGHTDKHIRFARHQLFGGNEQGTLGRADPFERNDMNAMGDHGIGQSAGGNPAQNPRLALMGMDHVRGNLAVKVAQTGNRSGVL